MHQRGHATARPAPGAFRCLVCRSYVTGTDAGHCPRCGFVPPTTPAVPDQVAPIRRVTMVVIGLVVVAVLVLIAVW